MRMDLTKPCSDCPFRNDRPAYLSVERAEEIIDGLLADKSFTCHKHNDEDDEGNAVETKDSQHCAGAMILLEKLNRPNQWMRWMERLGMYDRTNLDMNAPVFDSPEDFIDAQPE